MMLLLAFSALAQTSLVGQIVPQHDPQNGYEDYLRAADLVHGELYGGYALMLGGGTAPNPLPDGVSADDDDLAIKRKMVSRFEEALRMVKEGNSKDVYDPRSAYTPDTTFPEYAYFKNVARLESLSAHVAMADGSSAKATGDVIEGLTFCSKLSVGPLVSRLVGMAGIAILFRELNNDLPGMSLGDAERLAAFANGELADRTSAIAGLKRESGLMTSLGPILDQPKGKLDDSEGSGIESEVMNLSAADKRQLVTEVNSMIAQRVSKVLAALQGPESEWLATADAVSQDPPGMTLAERLFSEVWSGVGDRILVFEARRRDMWRLLRLSAMAVEYRWHNGKLPERLADFVPEEDRTDPISGKGFIYVKDGPWFKVTASGFANVQSISLGATKTTDSDADKTINPN